MPYDPTKSLGERFQDALFAGFGTMPVPAAYRVMPFAELPAEHQASWNRAAVNFTARLSDAPAPVDGLIPLSTIRNALRVALAFMEGFEADELQDGIDERIDTVRHALKLAEAQP